jgi:tetratricopeptide (TPR) repeat protein
MLKHLKEHTESLFKPERLLLLVLLLLSGSLFAQGERKFIRQGNREFEKQKYSESEISYRRAIDKNKGSADALFNTGDALYKQEKYEDAGKQFIESHKMNEDRDKKAGSLYNLGNSLLKSDKLKESIEAYKNSLRLNPGNMQAKYNLAYAQDRLKEQQQQQQQQQQQNQQNQDQNKDQQKKDQNNQEQQDDQKENEDQNKQDQQQQPDDQQQSISREDAERLLNAIANDEKEVQEKVKEAKAAKQRVKTLKNW